MSKIVFSTDWHLGLLRQANTTARSRDMWQDEMLRSALSLPVEPSDYHVCLGDVFDKYTNNESTINNAIHALNGVAVVLAGNHDVISDNSKIGSLALIKRVYQLSQYNLEICRADFGCTKFESYDVQDRAKLFAVPHHTTDSLFRDALIEAYSSAVSEKQKPKILLLHCNYNLPENRAAEGALNLSEDTAEHLLGVFDYILIGHEHTSSEHFDGRVRVLGSLFPTDFGNMSSKFYTTYDLDTGEMEKVLHWDAHRHYYKGNVDDFNCDDLDSANLQFFEMVGTVPRDGVKEAHRSIADIWKQNENLLGVRDNTVIERTATGLVDSSAKGIDLSTGQYLPDLITKSLKGTDMANLWATVLGEVR